jgi:hypothetical protein
MGDKGLRKGCVEAVTRKGDRVELISTDDNFTANEPGLEGTVTFIDSMGTFHVAWDNGSRLGLIPGIDQWRVIPKPKEDA